jgi:hypothetical protein
MLLHCADATGYRLAWRHELAGKRAKEDEFSRRCGEFGEDSGMTGVKSGLNGVPMVVGVMEKGVNPSYTSEL